VRHLLLALLLLAGPTTLHAQWRVTLLTGTASSYGDARDDTDPTHPEIHADAPATLAVSLVRDRGPWRVGLELHHTSADLAEISGSSAVTTRSVLKAWGLAFDLTHRLAGREGAPALFVSLGAGVDRWSFDLAESSPRWRATARGALDAELPINPAWGVVIRGQATAGPSVFKAEELPEGFVQRTAARVGVVFGVARRL
jgi:hypothetical protein